ncbi:MAG: flagellar protein FliS [Pontixanthobacter sp.]
MNTATISRPNVADAYRKVEREAAIMGSNPRALTILCYDELIASLESALNAHRRDVPDRRRDALHRAASALAALQLGIDRSLPIAVAISGLFDLAEQSLRTAIIRFTPAPIEAMTRDFIDIRDAMTNV